MAKRAKRRSRRGGGKTRRGSSFGGGRKGFFNTDILMQGAAVGGGLLLAPVISGYVPASLVASNRFALPAVKVGLGLAAAFFLGKKSPTLGKSLALGFMGSAAIDVYRNLNPGKASLSGYDTIGNYGEYVEVGNYGEGGGEGDTTVYLDDGSSINGYALPGGDVIDGYGNLVASGVDGLEGEEDEEEYDEE